MIVIMSADFIENLIARADKRRKLDQGAYLFYQGEPVKSVFVIEDGCIALTRYQRDGASIVLQRATGKMVLAEASAYSESYHCNAIAELPSSVFELPKAVFLRDLQRDTAFAYSWAAHLAGEVQSARYRSEILTRKTVAERLDGWLAWQGNKLPSKGRWRSLAVQLGVSPEALYRELSKRRSG